MSEYIQDPNLFHTFPGCHVPFDFTACMPLAPRAVWLDLQAFQGPPGYLPGVSNPFEPAVFPEDGSIDLRAVQAEQVNGASVVAHRRETIDWNGDCFHQGSAVPLPGRPRSNSCYGSLPSWGSEAFPQVYTGMGNVCYGYHYGLAANQMDPLQAMQEAQEPSFPRPVGSVTDSDDTLCLNCGGSGMIAFDLCACNIPISSSECSLVMPESLAAELTLTRARASHRGFSAPTDTVLSRSNSPDDGYGQVVFDMSPPNTPGQGLPRDALHVSEHTGLEEPTSGQGPPTPRAAGLREGDLRAGRRHEVGRAEPTEQEADTKTGKAIIFDVKMMPVRSKRTRRLTAQGVKEFGFMKKHGACPMCRKKKRKCDVSHPRKVDNTEATASSGGSGLGHTTPTITTTPVRMRTPSPSYDYA